MGRNGIFRKGGAVKEKKVFLAGLWAGVLCLAASFGVAHLAVFSSFARGEGVALETAAEAQSQAVEEKVAASVPAESAGEKATQAAPSSPGASVAGEAPVLADLLAKSWEALAKAEYVKVYDYARQAQEFYGEEAKAQGKGLAAFPATEKIKEYETLNHVAACLFVKAEALVKEKKNDEAKAVLKMIISDFPFAQAWDPRGWYWKVAEVARVTLKKIEEGVISDEEAGKEAKYRNTPHTKVQLHDPGKEEIIDYAAYGEFTGKGTKDYAYAVKNQEGLSEAAGEGIHPNTTSVRWDPAFQVVKKAKRLEGSHWDFVNSPDLQAAFIKWAVAPEPPGIRLFYSGLILERSGLIKHAIKCYYAIVVHFPHTVGWTYWHTPWYVGQAAIARIRYLCKKYPQVNMKLVGAKIRVENGFDNNISNDVIVSDPGQLIKNHIPETFLDRAKKYVDTTMARSKIKKRLGSGRVRFVQYENGDWQLLADGKPFFIKGITYTIARVGQSPDDGTLTGWMEYDYNGNGRSDGPYDAFVDKNGNNAQDKDEPAVGDFELMKRMGVNTIRLYHQPHPLDKKILRDLYERYGIRVVMGDFLGKYALGSGATWFEGTDYENPQHRKNMLESVRQMVAEFKNEPYVLMWLLGNENVYGVACNADKKPQPYFQFVNEVARFIKSLDPQHPVAVASGDIVALDVFAKNAPEVDAFGANVYRGDSGFGSFWEAVRDTADRPAFVTEYGCAAFAYGRTREEAEALQAEYLKSNWDDIAANAAFGEGSGNAIGGILFEWLDEWWKGYEPAHHDTKGLWIGPFPDGFMHEEWLGVASQGDGKLSPFLRQLRKSYYVYQELWRK